jgi:hypothetical protein
VYRLNYAWHGTERGDEERDLVPDCLFQIDLEPGVGAVDDEVYGIGRVRLCQFAVQLFESFDEALGSRLVEGREGADCAGAARLDH